MKEKYWIYSLCEMLFWLKYRKLAIGNLHVQIFSPQKETDLIAQVTFGLDISIFLVIDISFSESWQERRQIA